MLAIVTPCVLLAVADAALGARLSRHLLAHGFGLAGPGVAHTPADALARFKAAQPPVEVLLLDIGTGPAYAGLVLARALLAHRAVPLVLLAAQPDVQAFALACALAPAAVLPPATLDDTLANALTLALLNFGRPALAGLLPRSVFVRDHDQVTKLCVDDILYVEAGDRYCTLVTATGRYLVRQSLRDTLAGMPPDAFVQVHRHRAVNPAFIQHFNPGYTTVTVGGIVLETGRSYRAALLDRLCLLA